MCESVKQSRRSWEEKKIGAVANKKDGVHLGTDYSKKACVREICKLVGCGSFHSGSPRAGAPSGLEMVITLSLAYVRPDSSRLEFTTLSSLIALSHI